MLRAAFATAKEMAGVEPFARFSGDIQSALQEWNTQALMRVLLDMRSALRDDYGSMTEDEHNQRMRGLCFALLSVRNAVVISKNAAIITEPQIGRASCRERVCQYV